MKIKKNFCIALCLSFAFLIWTLAVSRVDVQAIGPCGTKVGFAALNGYVHNLTGLHMTLYTVTDLLSLIPLGFIFAFALLGLWQWVKRKSLLRVDGSILVLGGLYLVVLALYVLFELLVINYRPVLIDGRLEASYPSSTTMLVLCVMGSGIMQLRERIKAPALKRWLNLAMGAFTAFMVVARLLSGVHWFTDIVGGALLSFALLMLYKCTVDFIALKLP
jgi:undecaprenyl-diphosphatase